MLSCKDISHLASDHIDNNLPFFMKMKVKLHLFMCHNCRNFIKNFHLTVTSINQVKPAATSQDAIDLQVQTLMNSRQHINSENNDKS